MIKKIHTTLLVLTLFLSQVSPALALKFKDEPLQEGETINLVASIQETEVHADATFAHFWNNGVSGGTDGYNAIIDYRVETHSPLYRTDNHKGSVVTRVEGFGTIDHPGRNDFFDDALIDIPELFWQDDSKINGHDTKFVFGKFANRRFFDKDEIAPDPFDIGERPFFGTLANTNTVLNSINATRDADHLNSIQATGSYGFMGSIKDNDGDTFFDKWGYKQAFAVAQLDQFGDNFYGISELNKNWGEKYPGQYNLGYLYGNDDVFRIANGTTDGDSSHLFYTSWVQKIHKKVTGYVRYGLANHTDGAGGDFSVNHITSGLVTKPTSKDIIASHIVWTQSRTSSSPVLNLNFWIHKFTENINSTVYYVWKYGVPNGNTFDGEDNSWFIGAGLTMAI